MTLRPLDGLRVLDLSRALSGPFAGRILADLGADVVKVELPGADIAQTYGKMIRGRSGLYSQLNAGKRSIELDLRRPGDVARLLDLAAACDVVVENFRPGVLDRFGVGWPAMSAVNQRLVMLSISGFGQDGPEAERAAYAPIIHAEAGLIGRQADVSGGPPADIALALADSLAGLHGTIAILAALRLRDRTGTGQHIDVSMLDAMLATDDYTHYSIDEHPIWPARGETWPAPGGPILISSDRRHLWRRLTTCFGVADPDPDAPLDDKLRARVKVITEWIAGHQDRDSLKRDLEAARLAWAEIRHAGDVLASPSVAGRGTIVEVTDGDGERRSVVRMPYRFSDAASGPARGVPQTGEHTKDVLREWTGRADLPDRSVGAYREVGIRRRTCGTVPARLDQRAGGFERPDLGGIEPEFFEDLGVMLALTRRQLTLVGRNLVREVPRTARDLDLATRPVRHGPHRMPIVCPVAVCELLDAADPSGSDLGLVQLGVE
jgi:CoA:oxalate CoA-transferase